jgi:hypothetical protein
MDASFRYRIGLMPSVCAIMPGSADRVAGRVEFLFMSESSCRRFVRLLPLAVVMGFVAQVYYVARADEPYPALMMPRFSWAGPEQAEALTVTSLEIELAYADGTHRLVRQKDLLSHVPEGHHPGIMNHLLGPLPETAPARARAGKLEPPLWLMPGYNLAEVTRTTPEHVRSLKEWLLARARLFHSAAPLSRCTASWYDQTYRGGLATSERLPRPETRLAGRFEILFDEQPHSAR